MKRLGLILLLLLCSRTLQAAEPFVFNAELVKAYYHIMALRLDQGLTILESEKKKNPDSPALAFISDYHFFLRSFINEDVKEYDEEIAAFHERLNLIKKGDKQSPYYNYCQAELLIHQAAMRFKFGDYIRGAQNVRESYLLLKENIAKYPDFKPNYKSIGALEVLIGTVPPKFSWVTNLLGMQGNIPEGMKKIESYRNAAYTNPETEMFKEEALFLYAFLQLHIVKEKDEAWKDIDLATRDYRSNLLHCYARAAVAQHCKKTDEMILTLSNRPKGKEYAKFYFLEYMLGTAYLHKLDTNAQIHLKTFVSLFKGKNYIKDAYRKLAWSYLCAGDMERFKIYMGMVIRFGNDQVDEDKQALREAEHGEIPHTEILKSRMLFDGGYYEKALAFLTPLSTVVWKNEREKIEYPYRLARVYDEMGNDPKAIVFYLKTIDLGGKSPWYFAANSSLHLGYLYERKGNYALAKLYFDKAMSFPNDEYKLSISQKAKAGLERIKHK
ncbi:MAG: tetratricopeptide repeat protein [Bacteroidota bacterium]|nr:tetratricopeptide repeat protein [Bacteroidota bacterium]MDX5429601.1 tetratricopeptide repeat protein [Bacteroidota bacterium]MDX5468385.1 tetratricopeptide repeat protein [Bacteroidota bacterium]